MLNTDDEGETQDSSIHIQYQYSVKGGTDDENWIDIQDITSWHELANPSRILFIRAKLWRDQHIVNGSDDNFTNTPLIKGMSIDLKMELPNELYVRTVPCIPRKSEMLQGNVWGRVCSKFQVDPTF